MNRNTHTQHRLLSYSYKKLVVTQYTVTCEFLFLHAFLFTIEVISFKVYRHIPISKKVPNDAAYKKYVWIAAERHRKDNLMDLKD
jgi:hypothetical protein